MQLEDMSNAELIALVKLQEAALGAEQARYESLSQALSAHPANVAQLSELASTQRQVIELQSQLNAVLLERSASANVAQVGELSDAQAQNLDLVINRLETISANNTDTPRVLADEALVCARAIIAAMSAPDKT